MGIDERLQGLSYPDWQERWVQYALGANPYYNHQPGEPLFIHGKLTQKYSEERTAEPNNFTNIHASILGQSDNSKEIYSDTPIVINVMGAFYFVGDLYEGQRLESAEACLAACQNDMKQTTNKYCEIKKVRGGGGWQQLTPYEGILSRFFVVDVSDRNPYLDKLETPLQPGLHQGYTVNNSLIIKELDEGEYIVRFESRGKGPYKSDGIYQLVVNGPFPVRKDRVVKVRPKLDGKIISVIDGKEIVLD